MSDKLIYILPFVTLLLFVIAFHLKAEVKSYLLFVLIMLPLMDVKVVPESMGAFKTFDVISFYCFFFLIRRFTQSSARSGLDYYFFIFLLVSTVVLAGVLASEYRSNSFIGFIKLFPVFIYVRLFIAECCDNPKFLSEAISALRITFCISLGFLLIQVFAGLSFTLSKGINQNTFDAASNIIRYPGIFNDSQAHGQFLAIGSFIFLYRENAEKQNTYLMLLFILMVAALILAGSRSAFGGFVLGLSIVIILGTRNFRMYSVSIIILLVLLNGFLSSSSGIFSRAKNMNDDYAFRRSLWQSALKITESHAYLGIGIGNYQSYVKKYDQDQYWEIGDEIYYFDQPENGYLKILVELGYSGFSIFLLFVLSPVIMAISKYERLSNKSNLVMVLLAALASWIIAFNTVYTFFDNRILILIATILTMLVAAVRQTAFNTSDNAENAG